jgi:hypothetical protein
MSEPNYKLNPDGTAALDVPMGNKIKHLTFDYTETAMLAAIVAHLAKFGICPGRLSSKN